MNTEGSYSCTCNENFVLASDRRSCLPSCGGSLTQNNGSFSTPGWPVYYPSLDFRCEWTVVTDADTLTEIQVSEPYGIRGRHPCSTDYLQVLDGVGESAKLLGRFCFLRAPGPFLTNSNMATVIFQASSQRHLQSRVGVGITYTTIRSLGKHLNNVSISLLPLM